MFKFLKEIVKNVNRFRLREPCPRRYTAPPKPRKREEINISLSARELQGLLEGSILTRRWPSCPIIRIVLKDIGVETMFDIAIDVRDKFYK